MLVYKYKKPTRAYDTINKISGILEMKCQFQKELNEDIKLIKNENRLFVKADKSTNFYTLQATRYILRLVRISLLISAIQRVLRFFRGKVVL